MRTEPPLPTLHQVLANVHFRVTLFAVCMAGITVLLAGLIVMRAYAWNNLELVARSAGYTVEAALVFGDRAAAAEATRPLAANESVAGLTVLDASGRVMADWHRPGSGFYVAVEQQLDRLLFPRPATAPVHYQGSVIGEVRVAGNSRGLVRYMARGLLGMLVCLAITAAASILLARRLDRRVVGPLGAIAEVAHAVRTERAFSRRAPGAEIAEIEALSGDFNALLAELENWQEHLRVENETLAHRATHDALTGLPNRAFFEAQLVRAVTEARAGGYHVAVLYLDGDRFKEINDRFGHAAGDAVLQEMARRIRAQLKASDVVARLGGDEFAVLLRHTRDRAAVGRIADAITGAGAMPMTLPGGDVIQCLLSAGIALFPDDGEEADALMRAADAAMYASKQSAARGPRPELRS